MYEQYEPEGGGVGCRGAGGHEGASLFHAASSSRLQPRGMLMAAINTKAAGVIRQLGKFTDGIKLLSVGKHAAKHHTWLASACSSGYPGASLASIAAPKGLLPATITKLI